MEKSSTSLRLPTGLVCTDFDGTLFDGNMKAENMMAFKDVLDSLKTRHGTRWAIVTGRPLKDLLPLLGLFMSYRLFPDYVVVADALIFKRNAVGRYRPFFFWNAKIKFHRHTLFRRHSNRLAGWKEHLMQTFPEATDRSVQQMDVWLDFPNPEMALAAEKELLGQLGKHTDRFLIFLWGNELFLAPAAGTKGEAVRRLAKKLKVSLEDVFAVGDGPNDLPMLQEGEAGMTACVGNASERIKEVVGKAGGYIAKSPCLEGVLEALYFYTGVEMES